MKAIYIIISIFLLSTFGYAQTDPCYLSSDKSLELRGFQLQMSVEDAQKNLKIESVVKEIKTVVFVKKTDDKFEIDTTQNKDNRYEFDFGEKEILKGFSTKWKLEPPPPNLEGVDYLSLTFYENSLYRISITYVFKEIKWKNLQEFVFNISEKLNLTKQSWKTSTNSSAILLCKDFSIAAVSFNDLETISVYLINNSVKDEIQNKALQAVIKKQSPEIIEQQNKKKVFKP